MMNIENYKKKLESMSKEELANEISNLINDSGMQLQNKCVEIQELKSALARADLQLQFQIGEVDLNNREIERLNKELTDVYENRVEICKQLAEQKAEIERLTKWKDKLQDTKDELEQQLIDIGFKEYCEENKRLENENAELQKQVDELKQENANLKQGKAIMLDGITDLNRLVQFPVEYEGKNFEDIADLGNYIQEQAVKDTVKKCKQVIKAKLYPDNEWVDRLFEEEFGVEVE